MVHALVTPETKGVSMKNFSLRSLARRVCALVLSAALVLPMTARAAVPSPVLTTRQPVTDGLIYTNTVSTTAAGRLESFTVELPRSSALEPILLQSSGTIYGGASMNKAVELAQSMGLNVYAAINTDYFSTATGIPLGIVIEDGVYKSDAAGAPAMLIGSGGVTLCADPQVSLSLLNHTNGTTVTPNYFNKLRVATGGMYLLNADFSTVSTRTNTPGWFVRLKQTSPVPAALGVNSTISLQVTELVRSDQALTIGADEYILTADDSANLDAVFESFREGDIVTLQTSCADPALAGARYAGGVGDTLVRDGALTPREEWLHPDSTRAPRSALGVRADGTLVLYAADGRQSGYSVGLTLTDLADEMLALGCQWAVNLDGGGSTALSVWVPGQSGPSVQSSPSDGRLRSCATYLLIVGTENSSSSPDSLAMTQNGLCVLAGSSVPLGEAAVLDNVLNPIATDAGTLTILSQQGLGTIADGVYTAGMIPGTDTLTLRSDRLGVSGETQIHVIGSLSEMNVHVGDSAANLSSLSVNPGDSIQLSVTGSYYGRDVACGGKGVTFSVSEGLGSVDENGLLTISPTAAAGGEITVSAGGLTKTIAIKLLNVHLDVLSDHWAFNAVDFCYRNGIVNGISTTEFGANHLIRRADFVLMLYSALGRPAVSQPCTFTDVAADAYYYTAMAWAQSIGLIGGMGDGSFQPSAPITREQAFTVLRRILPLLDLDCPDAAVNILSRFSDADQIADYARVNTATLVAQGIVGGNGSGLNPKGNLTRAEMATLVYKVMNHTPVTGYPEDIPGESGGSSETVLPPEGAALTLNLSELTLWSGEQAALIAALTPAMEGAQITWSSSDPTVAAVSPDGVVTNLYTGIGTQTAVITATCGSLTASCTVSCPQAWMVGIIYNAAGGLNIRSGPGTSFTPQGRLDDGDVVVVLDHTDGWYKILYPDGTQARVGYVSDDYVVLNLR